MTRWRTQLGTTDGNHERGFCTVQKSRSDIRISERSSQREYFERDWGTIALGKLGFFFVK